MAKPEKSTRRKAAKRKAATRRRPRRSDPPEPLGFHPEAPEVAIFGGGIAGLTAAHELVERGFHVEVYEKELASAVDYVLDPEGVPCALGGMARTQWARADRPPAASGSLEPLSDVPSAEDDAPLFEKIYFHPKTADYADPRAAEKAIEKIGRWLRERKSSHVEVRGHSDVSGHRPDALPDGARIDYRRADAVAGALERDFAKHPGIHPAFRRIAGGLGYPSDPNRSPEERSFVDVRVVEDWFPGEHGFRFFPAFYRNLFDTLARIPIPHPGDGPFDETHRTVLDNVQPTEFLGIATEHTLKLGKPPEKHSRRPPRSFQELFDQVSGLLQSMNLSLTDIVRFQRKLFEYATSCSERRAAEYENISWKRFLAIDQFSESFRKYLDSTAQSLVAMDASQSDARTYGNISLQMLKSQFAMLERTDGTLNAPTSLAWFDHWRRYLVQQGVRFHQGELRELKEVVEGGNRRLVPVVEVRHRYRAASSSDALETSGKVALMRDYYVLAVPGHVLKGLKGLQVLLPRNPGEEDLEKIASFPWGDPKQAVTGGALTHMAGIQFFFENDFRFIRGHLIYPDSEWRLSSVSQPRFWNERRGWWSGYRGLLSVDISRWDVPAKPGERPPWDLEDQKVAERVWSEIRQHAYRRERAMPLPAMPRFYYLDRGIRTKEGKRENETPLLINRPGEYGRRPGHPGAYAVSPSGFVVAGAHAQTYTRLTTMEAANESARHAVNAILEDACKNHSWFATHAADRVETFDPETDEFPDLRFLVDLDQRLFEQGLPHLVEILDLDEVPEQLLRPDPDIDSLICV